MAYRKRRSRSTRRMRPMRKRSNVRRRNWRRNTRAKKYNLKVPVYRTLKSVPERLAMNFRYVDNLNISATGQTLSNPFIYSSGMWRPNVGGASLHQPMYFDQMVAATGLYNRYRVFGVKYRWTILNRGINECFYCIVRHQNNTTVEAGPTDRDKLNNLCERGDATVRVGGSVNGSHNRIIIKGFMNVAKTLGLTSSHIRDDETFSGDYTANPVNMAYLMCYIFTNLASGTGTYESQMDLTFFAELYAQQPVAGS